MKILHYKSLINHKYLFEIKNKLKKVNSKRKLL